MMPADLIAHLNALNRAFYAITAQDFSATRGRAWQGWYDLLPHLPSHRLRVLDVGCGNGRWGVQLAEEGRLAHYHGIDNNADLLTHARQALATTDAIATWHHADIIADAGASLSQLLQGERYDVVGVFGVVHHVPCGTHRRALMRALADCVASGELLVFATWRFYEFERLRERIINWHDYDAEHGTHLAQHVEPHDYLLDWRRGERALRYCHYVDDAEQDALIQAMGMQEIARYRADGQDNRMNCYSVLREGKTP